MKSAGSCESHGDSESAKNNAEEENEEMEEEVEEKKEEEEEEKGGDEEEEEKTEKAEQGNSGSAERCADTEIEGEGEEKGEEEELDDDECVQVAGSVIPTHEFAAFEDEDEKLQIDADDKIALEVQQQELSMHENREGAFEGQKQEISMDGHFEGAPKVQKQELSKYAACALPAKPGSKADKRAKLLALLADLKQQQTRRLGNKRWPRWLGLLSFKTHCKYREGSSRVFRPALEPPIML